MGTKEFRLHKGARVALTIAGVLCMLLVIGLPIGIWILVRAATGKLVLSASDVRAKALGSTHIALDDVARIGICRVPIVARGIGGALARQKVGGDHAINICVMTKAGKTKKFTVSMFENHEAITAQIHQQVGLPYEEISVGLLGMNWPKQLDRAA